MAKNLIKEDYVDTEDNKDKFNIKMVLVSKRNSSINLKLLKDMVLKQDMTNKTN